MPNRLAFPWPRWIAPWLSTTVLLLAATLAGCAPAGG